jgi:hypothetical protein
MKNENYKIAKLQAQQHTLDTLVKVATTPIVEFGLLVLLIREMEKAKSDNFLGINWFGMDLEPKEVFTIGTGIIAIQALAPLVPSIVQGGTDIIKTLPALALLK